MKAIHFDTPGDPDVLRWVDRPDPSLAPGEVLIAVRSAGVNRADVLQRRGLYPPPPGASSTLGLEAAGHVLAIASPTAASDPLPAWLKVGQPVMALLAGGGYAEQVAVPVGQVLPIPNSVSLEEAGALPEVFLTAFLNLFHVGGLPFGSGQSARVLIHGGASGVGTAAIQLCHAAGLITYCTVGDAARAQRCLKLGAHAAWNYRETDFHAQVLQATRGAGVDLILDCIGAEYLDRNLRSLALDGRLVLIGLMGGSQANLDLALLLRRRIQMLGSTLRALPTARKAALCADFATRALPLFERGALRPIVDQTFPMAAAAFAHRALDSAHFGKLVLVR
ncbi:MAG: NAD(P)H-quinone oxidoreductase [Myxococcales bacterium]|nr:NAD(P)H-quinone oxidoreductase [Myxococcales bacterium]